MRGWVANFAVVGLHFKALEVKIHLIWLYIWLFFGLRNPWASTKCCSAFQVSLSSSGTFQGLNVRFCEQAHEQVRELLEEKDEGLTAFKEMEAAALRLQEDIIKRCAERDNLLERMSELEVCHSSISFAAPLCSQ